MHQQDVNVLCRAALRFWQLWSPRAPWCGVRAAAATLAAPKPLAVTAELVEQLAACVAAAVAPLLCSSYESEAVGEDLLQKGVDSGLACLSTQCHVDNRSPHRSTLTLELHPLALVLVSQLPVQHAMLLPAVEHRAAAIAGAICWATANLTLHRRAVHTLSCSCGNSKAKIAFGRDCQPEPIKIAELAESWIDRSRHNSSLLFVALLPVPATPCKQER